MIFSVRRKRSEQAAVGRLLRLALAALLLAAPGYAARMQRMLLATPIEADAEPAEEPTSSQSEYEEYADASKNCSRWGRCVRLQWPKRLLPLASRSPVRSSTPTTGKPIDRSIWGVSRLLC